jgi:FAD:protein FMN transferase
LKTISFLFLQLIIISGSAQVQRFSYTQPKMGSAFTIVLYAADSSRANAIALKAFALVDSLVFIFSDYTDSSELNRFCASAGTGLSVSLSPALFDILQQSKMAYQISHGTFDISLGPLTKLWRMARKLKVFPAPAQVKEKQAICGLNHLILDTSTHTGKLLLPGMQLDLGGIGQGYIAQKVIDFIASNGIKQVLVDVSGDIVARGMVPGKGGWTIGINLPEQTDRLQAKQLLILDKAVTTSGDVYQYFEHNGKKYSHIIDPATGYGITSQKNVTVIAADGTLADWLTKACSILPIHLAKKLATSMGAELLIAQIKNGKIRMFTTKGFARYWNPMQPAKAPVSN